MFLIFVKYLESPKCLQFLKTSRIPMMRFSRIRHMSNSSERRFTYPKPPPRSNISQDETVFSYSGSSPSEHVQIYCNLFRIYIFKHLLAPMKKWLWGGARECNDPQNV